MPAPATADAEPAKGKKPKGKSKYQVAPEMALPAAQEANEAAWRDDVTRFNASPPMSRPIAGAA